MRGPFSLEPMGKKAYDPREELRIVLHSGPTGFRVMEHDLLCKWCAVCHWWSLVSSSVPLLPQGAVALCTWGDRGDCPSPEREGSLLWLNNTESFCKVQRCPGRGYHIQLCSLADLITLPIVQSLKLCPTHCHLMNCSMPGFPVLHSPRVCSDSCPLSAVMPCKHLTLRHPSPPAFIFPSIRVFSSESALRIRWPKYWTFSFSINPSSEYSEFISLRIDWFDLLDVQGSSPAP